MSEDTARALAAMAPDADAARDLWLVTADALACRVAGAGAAEAARLAEVDPVAASVAAIRASGAEPVHGPSGLRPVAVAVPVALAGATEAGAYLRSLTGACAAGAGLVAALGPEGAPWPTRAAAPAIAAVAAALARGADAAELELVLHSAMADLPEAEAQREAVDAAGAVLGAAALSGMRMADAAEVGAQGDATRMSWPEAAVPRAEIAAELAIRPYAAPWRACGALLAMTQVRAAGIDADDVLACKVALAEGDLAAGEPGEEEDLALLLGWAVARPGALMERAREEAPEAARDFAEKVTVVGDPALAPGTARLRLKTLDGVVEKRADRLPGAPDDPDRAGLVRRKAEAFGAGQALALLDALEAGEDDAALLERARAQG